MPTTFKDLTLREGAQVPGLEITEDAGMAVLDALDALGVDCVEIAFPRANPRASWYRHADDLGLRTAALARAVEADVDAALDVDPDEVEVIVNASDVQLEYALGKTREEALDVLEANVHRAAEGADVGASLMDAVRADNDFLREGARRLADAGVDHVTLADTTGSGTPDQVADTVAAVADEVGGEIGIAVHTHDDLGVAAANTLAAVDAGATSADVTVGGVGERVGNAPLEEVTALLTQRGDDVAIDVSELVPACRRVLDALDVDVPDDKPVLGELAYRHESGMHTAAMLREPSTYEPFDPAVYGGKRELLFGEGTGRGAARALLADVGADPTTELVQDALAAIRDAAERKGDPLTLVEAREAVETVV
ncbi:MAG: LeuA family protein [Haloferacaceae archaeon]